MPLIIPAIIGGVATIAGAAISSSATKTATNAATQAAAADRAVQTDIYNKNTALSQPSIDQGRVAAEHENALLGLSGDPTAAAKAFGDWRGSTGYQFRLDSGVNAITGNAATRGTLDSGSTLKAITQFGQNTADQSFNTYLGNVDAIAGRGTNAIGAITGAGQTYANQIVNANNQQASAVGTGALTNATTINSLLNNFVAGSGLNRGQSSYGQTPGAAPQINAMTFTAPQAKPAFAPSQLAF